MRFDTRPVFYYAGSVKTTAYGEYVPANGQQTRRDRKKMNAINAFLNKISNIPVLLIAGVLFVMCIAFFLPRMNADTKM